MKTPFVRARIATAVAGVAIALAAGQAFGTGFQLNEQSASSIGNAFAAGAAFNDDASAMWWNPAALSTFNKSGQVVGVLNIIKPSIKFQNDGSVPAGCYPPLCSPAVLQPLGGTGGDAGDYNFVPNLYLSIPINSQWVFGLGVNVPFGLTTEYDDGWIGRYQGLKSEIKTINVNPALSWQVTPTFAIGAGVNYQRIDATLTNNVNYSGALLQTAVLAGVAPGSPTFNGIAQLTPGLDSKATITGDDDTWGWNVGLTWNATPELRLAAAYRSEMKYTISGNIDFANPTVTLPPGTPAAVAAQIAGLVAATNAKGLYNRGITSNDTLPQIANFSFLWQMNPQWQIMGDVQWTGWSSIPELKFVPTDGSTLPAVTLNWKDTYKYSGGASYKYNDQWKWRFGVAFDQTPANDTNTTVRLPDSDRWWLAGGFEYKWSPQFKIDTGLVYIFADSPSFNQNQGSTGGNALVKGTYDASVWILSMQGTYSF